MPLRNIKMAPNVGLIYAKFRLWSLLPKNRKLIVCIIGAFMIIKASMLHFQGPIGPLRSIKENYKSRTRKDGNINIVKSDLTHERQFNIFFSIFP